MRDDGMTARLVDALYIDATAVADSVRAYGQTAGRIEREAMPAVARIAYTCEMMRLTTRLTHVIAWLLTRQDLEAGEISWREANSAARRLAMIEATDPAVMASLPSGARSLVSAGEALHARAYRLQQKLNRPLAPASPAHRLIARLENAF